MPWRYWRAPLYRINNHIQTWGRETKNYYGELIYTRLFTCCYKRRGWGECTNRDRRTRLVTHCGTKRCAWTQFCKRVCRKYRLSHALIQPLTRYSWVVLRVWMMLSNFPLAWVHEARYTYCKMSCLWCIGILYSLHCKKSPFIKLQKSPWYLLLAKQILAKQKLLDQISWD